MESTSPTFTCSSCQSPFEWVPLLYHGLGYCCAGCATGGPCCCSYDGRGSQLLAADARLPMVASEWERLTVEASLLQLHLARAIERRGIEFGAPRDESAEPIPLWDVERKQQRLAQVQDVLRRAEVTTPGEHPVIGALLTLQDSADEIVVYLVVAPGEGDPTLNRVPIDSPFGQLLVRAKVDSWLVLKVPAGSRRMRVVKISYPRTSTLDSGERPPEGGFVAEWAAR